MPSKCNKVKNPCKICLESVNKGTGLQCQGACKKWVHFTCLNYTPGKIRDVKAGIIKVTCPCPDCKTTTPKEFRTDQPFSCTNVQCPSNLPRSCTSQACPSNAGNQAGCSPLMYCEKGACKKSANVPVPPSPPGPCPAPPVCPIPRPQTPEPCGSNNAIAFSPSHGDMASPSVNVVEQICNTVGQLTNQINRLMCEMRTMVNEKARKGCDQPGPKAKCPKPCYCPNNPHN